MCCIAHYCHWRALACLLQWRWRTHKKMAGQEDPVQREIHQDWANREYIEVITSSIKKIADFLNSFDMSCRSRLATLNEKLTALERRIEYIEARVTKGETLT
ncbi:hypothetical protein SKAU_G00105550 [Synaphobranchus kaupii]|uniref:BRICK1 subunit of SCAR/WAVE actin nucleating complex n=1 Tax=Synaphobranchus kaupii TaxID=118154 RepID=A0A9Q1FZM6_SYNKA|nr:hypothetical protein SKAU_G00105550 [Synaphobranchus kaupii]